MTAEKKIMEVQEQEIVKDEGSERMRSRATFIPHSDIYETEDNVVVTLDMPGVEEDSLDITIEKNVLTINGSSNHGSPEGHTLVFAEFQPGDFERNFRLTGEINQDEIEAIYTDGVLKLILPKADEAKTRKISVKTK